MRPRRRNKESTEEGKVRGNREKWTCGRGVPPGCILCPCRHSEMLSSATCLRSPALHDLISARVTGADCRLQRAGRLAGPGRVRGGLTRRRGAVSRCGRGRCGPPRGSSTAAAPAPHPPMSRLLLRIARSPDPLAHPLAHREHAAKGPTSAASASSRDKRRRKALSSASNVQSDGILQGRGCAAR